MPRAMLEIREYRFEGVTILVKLDRREKKVSFVEWDGSQKKYVDKKWLFSGRELKYMNGWLNILSAMQYVIREVKKDMEGWKNESEQEMIQLFAATQKVAAKDKRPNDKIVPNANS